MDKNAILDKEFWKYRRKLLAIAWENCLNYFEGWKKVSELFVVAIFTALCSVGSLYIFRGSASMNDWWIIVISSIGGVFLYAVVIFLGKLFYASYEAIRKKENELEKYDWKNVNFVSSPFSVFGSIDGWSIKVENNKKFDLILTEMLISTIRIDKEIINLKSGKMYALHHIQDSGTIKARLVGRMPVTIDAGCAVDFVVTTKDSNQIKFETYPDELEWPFDNSDFQSSVVIEVETVGWLKLNNEDIPRPVLTTEFLVSEDGSLSKRYDRHQPVSA